MPGREAEYEAFKAQGGAESATGPAYEPPAIDDDRRSRSPGLRNNFYEVSQADFKRPHGMRGAVTPPEAPPADGAVECNSATVDRAYEDEYPMGVETAADYALQMRTRMEAEQVAAEEAARVEAETAAVEAVLESNERLEAANERLEAANERLEVALMEARAEEEVSRREAEEVRARERELQMRVESALQSNERLEAALAEMGSREEAARREAEEARAGEAFLSARLAALDARLEAIASDVAAGARREHAVLEHTEFVLEQVKDSLAQFPQGGTA
eukprot:3324060-Prymnesium_polylepis.1